MKTTQPNPKSMVIYEKVASDSIGGKAVIFAGYSGFLHQLQLSSLVLATIWQKKWRTTKLQIDLWWRHLTGHVAGMER